MALGSISDYSFHFLFTTMWSSGFAHLVFHSYHSVVIQTPFWELRLKINSGIHDAVVLPHFFFSLLFSIKTVIACGHQPIVLEATCKHMSTYKNIVQGSQHMHLRFHDEAMRWESWWAQWKDGWSMMWHNYFLFFNPLQGKMVWLVCATSFKEVQCYNPLNSRKN